MILENNKNAQIILIIIANFRRELNSPVLYSMNKKSKLL